MGFIHIYCGDGKGKTTASIGAAIRAMGSGMNVAFCQFFKNGTSNEIKILQELSLCTYFQQKVDFPFFFKMTDKEILQSKSVYTNYFDSILEQSSKFDMIVFDEIISTCNFSILDENYVKNKILEISSKCEIILTGREPSETLIEISDYVSEIKNIKHPFDKGIKARKGIEY